MPPPDPTVRLRLKCPDADDFVARFAPNVTRGGVFLPTHHARAVGAPIRFEIALADGTVVFAGAGVVTWVKPKGMGVKFTTLDSASDWMLERLLARREVPAAAPRETASPAPPTPAPPASATVPASPAPPAAEARPTPPVPAPAVAHESSAAVPSAAPAGNTSLVLAVPGPRRPLVRVAAVAAAVFVVIAIVWMSVGRARVGPTPSVQPPAPAVATQAAAPSAPAPAPPSETPPAPAPLPPAPPPVAPAPAVATTPPPAARAGALHIDSILVSASYKDFTCPDPTRRISVRSTKTVNVCLQVAHKPVRSDRLTLVWERDGAFAGKTPVEIPASKPTARTRVHMKISANRLGRWSVRVVGDRNAALAETDFEVVR